MPTTVTHTIKSSGGDYTSLSAWEAAQQRNLVTADQIAEAVCYGFVDTTNCTITGWTTDATRYIIVRADASAKSTMPPTTDGSRYLLRVASGEALNVSQAYTKVYDIQVEHTTNGANNNSVYLGSSAGMLLRNVISRNNNTGDVGRAYFSQGGSTPNSRLQNCVGIMINGTGRSDQGVFHHDNASTQYDNCLAFAAGQRHGFRPSNNDNIVVRNCLAISSTGEGFSGSGFDTTFSTNNATNRTTVPGANSRSNQTFTFVDSASLNFHLSVSDIGAKGYGVNLRASTTSSFGDDFDGQIRPSTLWDIGPDQISIGYRYVNLDNIGLVNFTDDFNRANGVIGSNYDTMTTGSGLPLTIVSNAAAGPVSIQVAFSCVKSSSISFSSNQEAQVTYTTVNQFDFAGPAVRVDPVNGNGYYLKLDGLSRGMAKITNGIETGIGSIPIVIVAGDTVKIRANGNIISAFKNGVLIENVTDTSFTTGQPGLYYKRENNNETRMDNFIANDLKGQFTVSQNTNRGKQIFIREF